MRSQFTFYWDDPHLKVRLLAINMTRGFVEYELDGFRGKRTSFYARPDYFGNDATILILPGTPPEPFDPEALRPFPVEGVHEA